MNVSKSIPNNDENPLEALHVLRRDYKSVDTEYHVEIRRILTGCYAHFLVLQGSAKEWSRFIKAAQQTKAITHPIPSSAAASKKLGAVVRYVTSRKKSNNRAYKYAEVLSSYYRNDLSVEEVATQLNESGIDALYENVAKLRSQLNLVVKASHAEPAERPTHDENGAGMEEPGPKFSGDTPRSQASEVRNGDKAAEKPHNADAARDRPFRPRLPAGASCAEDMTWLYVEIDKDHLEPLFSRTGRCRIAIDIGEVNGEGWRSVTFEADR